MYSIKDTVLESNKNLRINFDGGNLSSDGGLLLMKEFMHKIGFTRLLKQRFKTTDTAKSRRHNDGKNLLQVIYQFLSAYFEDDCADELTNEPVFTTILETDTLASQPTLSRFYNRMGEDTLVLFDDIGRELRRIAYTYEKPEMVLFDLDSTMLETYGKQEGESFNFHYRARGYHPLMCYDGMTGDLLRSQMRKGSDYTSTGVCEFMQPLFDEYLNYYTDIALFLRGDSGFATPDLYKQCESNGTSYVIRLKSNNILMTLAAELDAELTDMTKDNYTDYAVVYGEFHYQAGSWEYPRRVVCKIEKPAGQFVNMYTFIVTNMDSDPEQLIKFYCKRGRMENFIKEGKNGFDFASVSSRMETVNANRFQIHALTYNIFNWFRRLVLPEEMSRHMVDTIRLKLIRIAARIVRSSRYIIFKLCSSCPYKDMFYETLENIRGLRPQLE